MADVWIDLDGRNVSAGRLYSHRRRNVESASFTYQPGYLANPDAYQLDPTLPMTSGSLQTPDRQPIFGSFADSCPDRWGRQLIQRTEAQRVKREGGAARSFGQFDLLLHVRDDLRQGAIRYLANGRFVADDITGVPAMTDLPSLLSASDTIESDEDEDPGALALLLRAGSSLGGARPKAHVINHIGRLAIAKFPSPADDWNVMAWEKTALDLAAAAGIRVPASQLVTVAGRDVLIVDRFDRRSDRSRRGYMSAMTALEARDGDTRSYTDIAEVLEERSADVQYDLSQLWRRIAFSILISNTDDHLRNHALLHVRNGTWELSPAFDLNPDPSGGPKHLATAIDGDTLADVGELMHVAPLFRLTDERALAILGEVHATTRVWEQVAARNGLGKPDRAAMAPAFRHMQAELTSALVA